ncbi:MAG: peptide-methionine (R)-S-oxide reductase [Pseudomonadota bacterium]
MSKSTLNRRGFVKMSAAGVAGAISIQHTNVAASTRDGEYQYEVDFPDAQWKAMFDDEVYKILRKGDTEWPKSSKWWNDYRDGSFACIGCGLNNYQSVWRVPLSFVEHIQC